MISLGSRLSNAGLLLAATLVSSLSAFGSDVVEPIRIATSNDLRPFEHVDAQGRPAGLIVDLWKLWSQKTGVRIELLPTQWEDTLAMMRDGRADLHAGLNYAEERRTFVEFGPPLLTTNSYVFFPTWMEASGKLERLRGLRIGAVEEGLEHVLLRERVPEAEVIPFRANEALYEEVAAGRISLFADIEQTALYYLGRQGLAGHFHYDRANPLSTNRLFVGAAKGRAELLEPVSKGLKLITARERGDIVRRWLTPIEDKPAGALAVAMPHNNPPLTLIDANGEPAGLLVDIWRLWSRKTGREVHFKPSIWADTLYRLRSGEADLHSGLFSNEERAEWMAFSRPVIGLTSSLFHRTGEQPRERLDGQRVGVVFGYFHERYLREHYPDAHLVSLRDNEELVRALSKGEVDAVFSLDSSIQAALDRLGLRGAITSDGPPLLREPVHFGARKDATEIMAKVEEGLAAISGAELAEIERHWIPDPKRRFFARGTTAASKTAQAASSPLALSDEERAWIRANPRIRVHNETSWPPFNFAVDGEPRGYSIELMNLLAEKVGLEVDYVTGPSWNQFLQMMKRGELDVMLNIVKTPDRVKYLLFTSPIADNPNTILSRRDTPYESLEQLAGKLVSVPKGFFYEEVLSRDYPEIELLLLEKTIDTMKAVSFGKADAALGELAVFNHLLAEHMMTDLAVAGEVAVGDHELSLLNIATRRDLPILASILRKGVKAIGVEERRAIQRKWLGAVAMTGPRVVLTPEEKAWLAEHRPIRLGVDPDRAPFELIDPKSGYQGLCAEYVHLINDRLGLAMRPEPIATWSEVIGFAKAREVDVLPCVARSEQREAFLDFAQPHIRIPWMIFTRKDAPLISGVEGLLQGRVAVVKDYFTHDILRTRHPDLALLPTQNAREGLEAVSVGRVDAYVGNLAVATNLIEELNLSNLKVAAAMPGGEALHFAVRDDWPELVPILNKALASISPEEHSALRKEWSSIDYTGVDMAQVRQLLIQIGSPALLILIIILVWNRKLQREVVQRKRAEGDLERAKDAAEAANRAKSTFLATMSHEIRSPMNAILGLSHLALRTELTPKQSDYLGKIHSSAENLLGVITEILDFSKIEAGKLELEQVRFALRRVLDDVAAVSGYRAREKGLELVFSLESEVPQVLEGDPVRLGQVLTNLIGNAVKFTDQGEVVVQGAVERRETERIQLRFEVRDTGIGMEQERAETLFEAFAQADSSTTRKYGGTGLGLSISKRLVEAMGGSIGVRSTLGVGSTFSFTAWFGYRRQWDGDEGDNAPSASLSSGSGDRRVSGLAGLSVLLVEDNTINQQVAQELLQRAGSEVLIAENGGEALRRLAALAPQRPDAVLMDLQMPEMDGYEATRRIRSRAEYADLPIIAMTAHASEEERRRCLGAGMNDHVTKPVDPELLLATLSR